MSRPPSLFTQQPGLYPPGQPSLSNRPLPSMQHPSMSHPQHHAVQDANGYPYMRDGPPGSFGRMDWNGQNDGYRNTVAGPSRGDHPYQPYGQPHGGTSGDLDPTTPQHLAGGGWSSVHPYPSNHRPDPAARGTSIKLEDLVSQDHNWTGRSVTNGPAGLTSLPLFASQTSESGKPFRGPASNDASGGQPGPSEFIKKLYKMLEEESAMYGGGQPAGRPRGDAAQRGSVGWARGGSSFVVWDMNDFTTKILPQTFRHSNFSSFVRQLNKYGFSKIKHVDEETGQIKENIWEFQHPSFQSGGKADLDSIKRKAVAPKKGAAEGDPESPSASRPPALSHEDTGRLLEMEQRIIGLEDRLAKALDEVHEARSRELGVISVVREVVVHLAAVERESVGSPLHDLEPSPRVNRLVHLFDHAIGGQVNLRIGTPARAHASSLPFNPALLHSATSTGAQPSPLTDASGSAGSREGPSPAGSKASMGGSARPVSSARSHLFASDISGQADDIIEIPQRQQAPFNGEPFGGAPMYVETPSWLTEATTASIPMYHRKSSDGATLRLMVEALTSHGSVRCDESQDPLDMTHPHDAGALENLYNGQMPAVEQSPFGTLLIPPQPNESNGDAPTIRLRRSTVAPHWTHSPRILVVEDDVVYRQLSSKFLEKFGCVTETVDDAQGAIEKMNRTKYDLVLMDIFFGPSMDGRKATSLIRQFDMYTPIISMTSNAQPQDVDSYLQSGMNDVLAKPFTKHGLFGILDKHLMHLKAIQLSAEIPRSLGLPPLSDQGLVNALATGAAQWIQDEDVRNPLAAMGWSDETYQIVLQQFIATGSMPNMASMGTGTIGTNVVFGDSAGFDRKRSIEAIDDDWSPAPLAQIQENRVVKKAKNVKR